MRFVHTKPDRTKATTTAHYWAREYLNLLMNELNFASDAAGPIRVRRSVEGGRRGPVGRPLGPDQQSFFLLLLFLIGVTTPRRRSVLLAAFLLDSFLIRSFLIVFIVAVLLLLFLILLQPVPPALSGTLDPISGCRRKVVRIPVTKLVCKTRNEENFTYLAHGSQHFLLLDIEIGNNRSTTGGEERHHIVLLSEAMVSHCRRANQT